MSLIPGSDDGRRGEKIARLWIVVCENFHWSIGPYAQERYAQLACDLLNKAKNCRYRVMPLMVSVEGGVETVIPTRKSRLN